MKLDVHGLNATQAVVFPLFDDVCVTTVRSLIVTVSSSTVHIVHIHHLETFCALVQVQCGCLGLILL